MSPRVERLLAGVPRRGAPEGTLERILAAHARGVSRPAGRLLHFPVRDAFRVALPAAAAAAAVVLALGMGRREAPSEGTRLPMLASADSIATDPAPRVRVVNDATLPAYALVALRTDSREGP